jgi:hypothetical protein
MKALARKLWSSATLNTWAGFVARSLGWLLVMPLVLRRFSPEEVNVWVLFGTLLGLQLLVDMGFCVTFVRSIAYALAGAQTVRDLGKSESSPGAGPNWEMVVRIAGAMRYTYSRLALLFLALLALGGTALLLRPISQTADPMIAWAAWAVVVMTGFINLRSSYLVVLLQGLNAVALVQRWQALTGLGAVVSGFVALLAGGNLLVLTLATQLWSVVAFLTNRRLCRDAATGRFARFPPATRDPEILAVLWPPTWRSGVGVLMSFGLVQFTGLINAQFATASNSASYLLGLRLVQTISSFSQAPFYSKLALLPRLRGEGRLAELVSVAERGMRRSLWLFVLCSIGLGFAGPALFGVVGSNVAFPSERLWLLLGATFLIERYGAMHLNLYSTTNHVIAHYANGVTGLVSLACMLLFSQWWGLVGVPMGLFLGYATFYGWYPALRSYREFRMPFWRFELRTTAGPLLGMVAYGSYVFANSG